MKDVSIIGVDLAKNVFQLHGAASDGSVVYRKKLSRVQFERFMSGHPAMQDAIDHAEGMAPDAAPQFLAIIDRDERLVLAGAASDHAVAWCHPVMSAAEARGVVTEASQLRAQAGRASAWGEPDLARRLRHRADLLDGRLVDPLWRTLAARALQVAAWGPRDREGQGGFGVCPGERDRPARLRFLPLTGDTR
ncbi:MAG: hypothetical protein ACKO1H_13475 [Tabrizicola sp.]